jgi:rRNA processing protein Gar1
MASIAGLLSRLTGAQRALLPFFRQQVDEGIAPSQILRNLRAEGRGIRTQVGLDIIGVLQGNVKGLRVMRTQPTNQIIDTSSFPLGEPSMQRNYRYETLVRGVDNFGNIKNQYINIKSNEELSQEQVLAEAAVYAQGAGDYGQFATIESHEITAVFRNPALGG